MEDSEFNQCSTGNSGVTNTGNYQGNAVCPGCGRCPCCGQYRYPYNQPYWYYPTYQPVWMNGYNSIESEHTGITGTEYINNYNIH